MCCAGPCRCAMSARNAEPTMLLCWLSSPPRVLMKIAIEREWRRRRRFIGSPSRSASLTWPSHANHCCYVILDEARRHAAGAVTTLRPRSIRRAAAGSGRQQRGRSGDDRRGGAARCTGVARGGGDCGMAVAVGRVCCCAVRAVIVLELSKFVSFSCRRRRRWQTCKGKGRPPPPGARAGPRPEPDGVNAPSPSPTRKGMFRAHFKNTKSCAPDSGGEARPFSRTFSLPARRRR